MFGMQMMMQMMKVEGNRSRSVETNLLSSRQNRTGGGALTVKYRNIKRERCHFIMSFLLDFTSSLQPFCSYISSCSWGFPWIVFKFYSWWIWRRLCKKENVQEPVFQQHQTCLFYSLFAADFFFLIVCFNYPDALPFVLAVFQFVAVLLPLFCCSGTLGRVTEAASAEKLATDWECLSRKNITLNFISFALKISWHFPPLFFPLPLMRKQGADEACWRQRGNQSRIRQKQEDTAWLFSAGTNYSKDVHFVSKRGLSSGRLLNNEIMWVVGRGGGGTGEGEKLSH